MHDDYYSLVDLIFQYTVYATQYHCRSWNSAGGSGNWQGSNVSHVLVLPSNKSIAQVSCYANAQSSQKGNMSGLDQPICRSRQKILIVQVRSGRQSKR